MLMLGPKSGQPFAAGSATTAAGLRRPSSQLAGILLVLLYSI
jgi:hypothetical protein